MLILEHSWRWAPGTKLLALEIWRLDLDSLAGAADIYPTQAVAHGLGVGAFGLTK